MLIIGLMFGCGGSPVGTPCELSQPGPLGFGFEDSCRTQCLALTDVVCPDGRRLRPGVCGGATGCAPGGCPEGQACYAIPDPFDEERICVPVDVCDVALDVGAWEEESQEAAKRLREQYAKRRPAVKKPTAPVAEVPESGTSTLVARHGGGVAVLGCLVEGGSVRTGAACRAHVSAETEVALGGSVLRLGEPADVACPASGASKPGWTAEVLGTDDKAVRTWAWLPGPPRSFARPHASQRSGLPERVLNALPPHPGRQIELAASLDLDGDDVSDEVLRVAYPSSDPDKPGRTILWLLDGSPTGRRLPTDGVDLDGVQDVVGTMPLPGGGGWLLLQIRWMGGTGLHLVGRRPEGGLGGLYEVSCGS